MQRTPHRPSLPYLVVGSIYVATSALGGSLAFEGSASAQSLRSDEPQPEPGEPGQSGHARVLVAPINAKEAALIVEPGPGRHELRMEWPLGDRMVEINDLGVDGDVRARDGVYTGRGDFDRNRLLDARRRWKDRVSRMRDPKVSFFDGRKVRGTLRADPSMLDRSTRVVNLPRFGGRLDAFQIFPALATGGSNNGGGTPPGGSTDASLTPTTDPYKTLVITDPKIVRNPDFTGVWENQGGKCVLGGNPDGLWGIRGLLRGVANGFMSPDELGSRWLNRQANARTVNGWTIPAIGQGIYDLHNGTSVFGTSPVAWPKLYDDGVASQYTDVLDWKAAPLQLLAIVNRIDLAAGGYEGKAGAELRFVFTFINEETCEPDNGTIIFEYNVPSECDQINEWAKRWYELDNYSINDPQFIHDLAHIVEPIVAAGANPQRPNESNLKVLRTNEQTLTWPHYETNWPTHSGRRWQMEEWAIDGNSHYFANKVLAAHPGQTWELPDWSVAAPNPQPIDHYVVNEDGDILDGTNVVGATYSGHDFAAGFAPYGYVTSSNLYSPYLPSGTTIFPTSASHWRELGFGSAHLTGNVLARQTFSMNTCTGCHFAETFEDGEGSGTFESLHVGQSTPGGVSERPFQHVAPDNNLSNPAHLSRFITGTNASCTPGQEFVSPLGTMSACSNASCCPIGDPVFGYDTRQVHFNEFARRGAVLEDVALMGCEALRGHKSTPVVNAAH